MRLCSFSPKYLRNLNSGVKLEISETQLSVTLNGHKTTAQNTQTLYNKHASEKLHEERFNSTTQHKCHLQKGPDDIFKAFK